VAARIRTNQASDVTRGNGGVEGLDDGVAGMTIGLQVPEKTVMQDTLSAWQVEAANVDRSVRILPGVKRLIDSIPAGRYAVATSGAKTYGEFIHMIPLVNSLIPLVSVWVHAARWDNPPSGHDHCV